MAAASHPPGTLPPPSTQPLFRSHSAYGSDPYGAAPSSNPQYGSSDGRGSHTHHHHGGHSSHHHHHQQSAFQPPPPPPPYYDASPPPPPRGGPWGASPGAAAATAFAPVPPGPGTPHGQPPGVPTAVYVAPPKIEMQPWARNVWRWLVDNTTGVARVDLMRPTPPLPEQYDGNLLVVRSRQSVGAGGGGGFGRQRRGGSKPAEPLPAYTAPPSYYPAIPPAGTVGAMTPVAAAAAAATPLGGQPLLMGARIKITRSFLIGGGRTTTAKDDTTTSSSTTATEEEEGPPVAATGGATAAAAGAKNHTQRGQAPLQRQKGQGPQGQGRVRWRPTPLSRSWAGRPLLDIGVGVNLDAYLQQIQPVARIKIKDLVSIKAAPLGLLKISRSIPLGPVALKVRYELPLAHTTRFWEPPARLMVRLDSAAGSGVHLSPGGIEFDEQVVQFGDAVSLRASGSLLFPRQLPLVEGEPWLRPQLHRLSLRSIW